MAVSKANWKNIRAAYDRVQMRAAAAWAESPFNENLADKLYGGSTIYNADHRERGCCSPLGGQAVTETETNNKRRK
jgi:hypothetical protein